MPVCSVMLRGAERRRLLERKEFGKERVRSLMVIKNASSYNSRKKGPFLQ